MGLLDTNVPQMVTSASSFADQASLFRSTVSQAESTAMQAQAVHAGESAAAFQMGHARFVEAAQKSNMLIDMAGQNINEGATTYQTGDQAGADGYSQATGLFST